MFDTLYDIMAEITHVSKALQAADVSLDTPFMLVNFLKDFLVQYREEEFKKSMSIAQRMANELNANSMMKPATAVKMKTLRCI